MPSSSSHALIGGFVGAAVAHAGLHAFVWSGFLKTAASSSFRRPLVSPSRCSWSARCRGCSCAGPRWRRHAFSYDAALFGGAVSLGHGGNDAQKTMGIIAALLYSQGYMPERLPHPALGRARLPGGDRARHAVRRLAHRQDHGAEITRLPPMGGFCAETGGAITLFIATALGVPVSTTHTITGAIVGVGAARRASAVRWNVARASSSHGS